MTTETNAASPDSAAFVCDHVARLNAAILIAVRDMPADEADSGWQFLCGQVADESIAAQIWSVAEVVEQEPSLLEYITLPAGTHLMRGSAIAHWVVGSTDEPFS